MSKPDVWNKELRFGGGGLGHYIGGALVLLLVTSLWVGLYGLSDAAEIFLTIFLSVVLLIVAAIVANVAHKKARSWAAFFWLSILINPLLVGLIVAIIPAATPTQVAPTPVAPDQGAVSQEDLLEKLERLGQLRDKGVITEADFETKKAELLGRL